MSIRIAVHHGPIRLTSRLPHLISKPTAVSPSPSIICTLHRSSRQTTLLRSLRTRAHAAALSPVRAPRRAYHPPPPYAEAVPPPPMGAAGALSRKLLTGAAVLGGTIVALNLVFNRETRDDGGMPPYERDYLNNTFLHTGLGVGIVGLAVHKMIQNGFVYRIMATNPWMVAFGGLALSFGTVISTRAVDPDNYVPKYALWTAFNVTQAALVAPLITMFPGAILARAGLYTVAMMGSISFVGATAKQEKYLYIGGPLLAGSAIVLMSGLAPLVVPATAARTLALTESLWLYGGLALFGGFTLYDVQKVLHHARLAERGIVKRDPVNESIGLELDFLQIFIRMAQILLMQQQSRRK